MNQEEQAAFDATQAEKKELGIVDEPQSEEASKEEPKDESTDSKESEEKSEEADESKAKEETKSEDEPEDESEDDSDENDEADEDEEDSDEDESQPQHVSSRDIKAMKQGFKQTINDLKEKLRIATSTTEKKEVDDDIEKVVAATAEKLKVNPEVLRELVNLSKKSLEKDLSKFGKVDKLIEEQEQQRVLKEQEQIFAKEWNAVEPELKKQYPNATPEQLAKAKAELDVLAHSRKYHQTEMDYILFKEKEKFNKILFSPKKKTFESSGNITNSDSEDTGKLPTNVEDMTPAQFAAFERQREADMASEPREKMKLRTTDESGRIVEKMV